MTMAVAAVVLNDARREGAGAPCSNCYADSEIAEAAAQTLQLHPLVLQPQHVRALERDGFVVVDGVIS